MPGEGSATRAGGSSRRYRWLLCAQVAILASPPLLPEGPAARRIVGRLVGDIFRGGRISSDTIFGSVCVYLLIGTSWAVAYTFLARHVPGSFLPASGPSSPLSPASGGAFVSSDLVYFSFSTLTTLGFGDIVPAAPLARTLAWIEAVAGQIYLTVLVARLVGLHLAQRSAEGR